MQCPRCGSFVPDQAKFCTVCGYQFQAQPQPQPEPQPTTEELSASQPQAEQPVPPQPQAQPFAQEPQFQQPVPPPQFQQPYMQNPQAGQPQYQLPPMQFAGDQPAPKKKPKIGLILGIVFGVLIIAAAATIIPITLHNKQVNQYNDAVTVLEQKNYAEAITQLEALGDYEDCPDLLEYARIQLEYERVEGLAASGDYAEAIKILQQRIRFFGSSSNEGKNAAFLIEQYEAILAEQELKQKALDDYANGNYAEALEEFNAMDPSSGDYSREKKICEIFIAGEEQDWANVLVKMYMLQTGEDEAKFLEEPETEDDWKLYNLINYDDYSTGIADLVQAPDPILEPLRQQALNFYAYRWADWLYNFGDLEGALAAFEELGDYDDAAARAEEIRGIFADMASTYQQAMDLYNNGEYYKAKKIFDSLGDYENAKEMSASCKQTLPESGAFAMGNGSDLTLIIEAPASSNVYLKIYDTSGTNVAKVFIRAGSSASIDLTAGTYTMKVGYGDDWYGETDLFGDDGTYSQLLNGESSVFELEYGYEYTLTLGGVVGGNVGSEDIGGAGGM